MAYTDSFAYSDGNLQTVSGGNWTNRDINLDVLSGSVVPHSVSNHNNCYYSAGGSAFADDQYSECKIVGGTSVSATAWCGPAIRMNITTGACYVAAYYANGASSKVQLNYYNGTGLSATSGTPYTVTLTPTDVLRIEAVGSSLSLLVNGTVRDTWTHTTLTNGKAGLHAFAAVSVGDFILDDWGGGDVSAGVGGSDGPIIYVRRQFFVNDLIIQY